MYNGHFFEGQCHRCGKPAQLYPIYWGKPIYLCKGCRIGLQVVLDKTGRVQNAMVRNYLSEFNGDGHHKEEIMQLAKELTE